MSAWALLAEIGGPSVVLGAVWRLRGWVDGLRQTDQQIAQSVLRLDETIKRQHTDNQRRLAAIERKLHDGDYG